MIKFRQLCVALVVYSFLVSIHLSCTAQDRNICRAKSVSMNTICKEWDGQWQGIIAASDGNCYFATSTHSRSHGAGFHRYNPSTGEHMVLAEDMTIICGEEKTQTQQGKIHSPIIEHKGWLYFSTHLSNYWPEGIELYTGAHILGYEIATGKFLDFGIVKPRYSVYSAINIDREKDLLYIFVAPFLDELVEEDGCHLYSMDINTGKKKDLGKITVGERAACFWFFVDSTGNCWFTFWKKHYKNTGDHGNLYCYNPDLDQIITYKNVLPRGERIDGKPVMKKELLNSRSWTWAAALPGNEKCLFTMGVTGGGDERLWLFDPSKDIWSGAAFQPLASIGSTFLETALGGGRVYYVQYASMEDQRREVAEANREKDPGSLDFDYHLHLRSIAIDPGEQQGIVDHGAIMDQDGRIPAMINSLAADDQGRVFMMGSWFTDDYREASMQIQFYDHPGENLYKLVDRGEFFAVTSTK